MCSVKGTILALIKHQIQGSLTPDPTNLIYPQQFNLLPPLHATHMVS